MLSLQRTLPVKDPPVQGPSEWDEKKSPTLCSRIGCSVPSEATIVAPLRRCDRPTRPGRVRNQKYTVTPEITTARKMRPMTARFSLVVAASDSVTRSSRAGTVVRGTTTLVVVVAGGSELSVSCCSDGCSAGCSGSSWNRVVRTPSTA